MSKLRRSRLIGLQRPAIVGLRSPQRAVPAPSNDDEYKMPIKAGELILQTFELRRAQLIAKATIAATASSGLIVLTLQAILLPVATQIVPRLVAIGAILFATMSLLENLNVIKKLGRRTRKTRSRTHMLYFGTFAKLDATAATTKLRSVDASAYLAELASQAVAISRNLRARYDALGRAYRWLAGAIAFFLVALIAQQFVTATLPPAPATTATTSTTAPVMPPRQVGPSTTNPPMPSP